MRLTLTDNIHSTQKRFSENVVDDKTMDPKDIDVIKVQEIFQRLFTDKTDDFDQNRQKICFEFLFDVSEKYYSERNTTITTELVERATRNQIWIGSPT